jgi:hypothetical protein
MLPWRMHISSVEITATTASVRCADSEAGSTTSTVCAQSARVWAASTTVNAGALCAKRRVANITAIAAAECVGSGDRQSGTGWSH